MMQRHLASYLRAQYAQHPVSAMLNYGYAVLESQVRIAIAEAGLDPSIGYLRVCQPGRWALVCDLMEPCRPIVDREVLSLIELDASGRLRHGVVGK